MGTVDNDAEALRIAVARALELADRQGNTLAVALLAQVLDIVATDPPAT